MKKTFIKYDPPYGGQSFKQKGVKNGYKTIITFLENCTNNSSFHSADLTIFEGKLSNEYNYNSERILETAFDLFGKTEKSLAIQNINNKSDFEYKFQWKIAIREIDRYINFIENQFPLPKYYIEPMNITLHYDFEWVDLDRKVLNYNSDDFLNNYFTKSHINLYLSKNNSIIMDLIFPFEAINNNFYSLYNNILLFLPVDLKMNRIRLYIPNKKGTDYKLIKI